MITFLVSQMVDPSLILTFFQTDRHRGLVSDVEDVMRVCSVPREHYTTTPPPPLPSLHLSLPPSLPSVAYVSAETGSHHYVYWGETSLPPTPSRSLTHFGINTPHVCHTVLPRTPCQPHMQRPVCVCVCVRVCVCDLMSINLWNWLTTVLPTHW